MEEWTNVQYLLESENVTSQIIPEMPICEYVLHALRPIDNLWHQG